MRVKGRSKQEGIQLVSGFTIIKIGMEEEVERSRQRVTTSFSSPVNLNTVVFKYQGSESGRGTRDLIRNVFRPTPSGRFYINIMRVFSLTDSSHLFSYLLWFNFI